MPMLQSQLAFPIYDSGMLSRDPAARDLLFQRVQEGDPAARGELFVLLNDELREMAGKLMKNQPPGHTLQATALVNEVFIKLFSSTVASWSDSHHVLATAATAMRHVLTDHARKKRALRRSPQGERVPLDFVLPAYEAKAIDLLALDEALRELETFDPEIARVVELRFFAGLELAEISGHVGIPLRTLYRRFDAAKAWLLSRFA